MRTPYIVETVTLEGTVLGVSEKVLGLIYQIRLQFQDIAPLAAEVLDKIEKYNTKGDTK